MDFRAQLDQIAARKRAAARLLEQVRAGLHGPLLSTAADHFARVGAPPPRPAPPPLPEAPTLDDMAPIEAAGGRVLHRRRVYTLGDARLGLPAAAVPPVPAGAALLATAHDGPPPAATRIGFLDTETTGLAGGAGTVAFLVGLGRWEASPARGWEFVLEQFLLEDFCHEAALVAVLAERLGALQALVTYNGRRFDVPLLRTRMVMHRVPPRALSMPQIDLLHPSRRLWRPRLGGASLRTIEAGVLGIDRGPDISGAEIPAEFFEFARTGRPGRLGTVLEHNAQDIATMAGLLWRLGRIAEDPLGCGLLGHWTELEAVARWQEARRRHDDAVATWREAMATAPPQEEATADRLLMGMAAACKRAGRREEAVAAWTRMRALPLRRSGAAWRELAIHEEHVARRPAAALQLVQAWRRRVELELDLAVYTGRQEGAAALQAMLDDVLRRQERLARRVAALNGSAPPRG